MKITKEIIIFQAPYASLVDCGFLKQICPSVGVIEKVPAQYYMPVFHGAVALEVPNVDTTTILEGIFSVFNQPNRPNAMTMRSAGLPRDAAGGSVCCRPSAGERPA